MTILRQYPGAVVGSAAAKPAAILPSPSFLYHVINELAVTLKAEWLPAVRIFERRATRHRLVAFRVGSYARCGRAILAIQSKKVAVSDSIVDPAACAQGLAA